MVAPLGLPENFRPLRRHEFHELAATGAFDEERVELVDGVLVPMNPIGTRHCSAVDHLNLVLVRALGDRARIRVQHPFAASDVSEPQPDVLVAPLGDYIEDHPSEAYLAIEVAETSLAYDRGRKLRLYADRAIPEYWIVDVVARRIEVHREPRDGRYASSTYRELGESIALLVFPDVVVKVDEIIR